MAKKKEEEKQPQQTPVIGTGSAAVDRFLSQPVLPALGNAISSFVGAITPPSSTQPATMAGVRPIPEGASASQLNPIPLLTGLYGTPLVRGSEAQRSEPRQTVAAATTLPSGAVMSGGSADIYPAPRQPIGSSPFAFDVTKTQTPSNQPITASILTGQNAPLSFAAPTPTPVTPLPPMPEPRTRYSLEYGRGSAMLTQQQQQNVQAAYARQQERAGRMAQFQNALARARELRRQNPINPQEQFFAEKRQERQALQESALEAARAGIGQRTIRNAISSYTAREPRSVAGIAEQFRSNPPIEQRLAAIRGSFGLPPSGAAQQAQTPVSSNIYGQDFANFSPFSSLNYPFYNRFNG